VSKPSAPRSFILVSTVAVVVAAVAVVVAAGPARTGWHSGNAPASTVAAATLQASGLSGASGLIQASAQNAEKRSQVRARLAALPLAFEANQGQTDARVKYMARSNGYTLFLTANDAVFALRSSPQSAVSPAAGKHAMGIASRARTTEKDITAAIHMQLVGGNPQAQIAGGSELPGRSNYFLGNDRSKWQQGVKQYAAVSYREVYPGVNLAFHGQQRQMEFDFVVSPGADASAIALRFSGAANISTDASGRLNLSTAAGNVTLHPPVAYQEKNGVRESVDARFVRKADNQIAFALGNYDRSRELVIDPSVSYATYLGGSLEDDGYAIAIDGSGDAYVTGQTKSTDFPTVAGAYSRTNAGGFDIFVTKIAADGSSLLYSTYIGGTGDDSGNAIAVDASGDAYVGGGTGSSTTFPVTTGAYQTTYGGSLDAFVLELGPTGGTLVFCTYLGGAGADVANGIALDSTGVYVVGSTASTNFPTQNPKQPHIAGTSNGFVTKLNTSGSTLVYSTFLGGGSNDFAAAVAVDSSNQAYVTGGTENSAFPVTIGAFQTTCGTAANCNGGLYDAFVTVFHAAGSSFVYSTFLGGESTDEGYGIAVDGAGDAYVTGITSSQQFPLKAALQGSFGGGLSDAFVTALNPAGSALLYSTYLGGSEGDSGQGIAVDGNQKAYVTGETASGNFPTASPTQSTYGGANDAFVTEINSSGALVFSTYLGGSGAENTIGGGATGAITVDSAGANFYVTGNTASTTNFPTMSPEQTNYGGGAEDAFVAKYTQSTGPSFTVTNGALSTTSGSPGVSATSTITVTSVNGFNSAVTLACAVSPSVSEGPTCAFSNPGSSVTPAANSTVTATLTVNTTAASALLQRPAGSRAHELFYAMLMPIGGVVLLGAGLGSAGARRRRLFGFLLLGLVLTGLLLMPACGGSSGGGGGGGNSGTPPNSYTISVTGASGGVTVNGAPALTLTVN
jgi:hypothetical protein